MVCEAINPSSILGQPTNSLAEHPEAMRLRLIAKSRKKRMDSVKQVTALFNKLERAYVQLKKNKENAELRVTEYTTLWKTVYAKPFLGYITNDVRRRI